MTTRNDITGDAIKTKSSSDAYRDGWDLAFKNNDEWVDPDDALELTEGWFANARVSEGYDPALFGELAKDEVYDQWKIDAENTKRLNELTQED